MTVRKRMEYLDTQDGYVRFGLFVSNWAVQDIVTLDMESMGSPKEVLVMVEAR
jgi:hypothetical protein